MTVEAGDVVAWWDGSAIALAVAGSQDKRRLRLVGADGKERRVQPTRVAFVVERGGPSPGTDPEDRRAAGRRVAEIEQRIRRSASDVEIEPIWELALESAEALEIRVLAELATGSASELSCAVVTVGFLEDGIHFVRKGERWEARTAEEVDRLRAERVTTARRAAEREVAQRALADAVREAASPPPTRVEGNETFQKYVRALHASALDELGVGAATRDLAAEALQASGIRFERPGEGAFRLLRALGRFASDDENLQIHRFGLRTEFPEAVLEAARQAVRRGYARGAREDLTGVRVITIDSDHTREIDDGLSCEPLPDGGTRVGVHIADPGAFVEPDDPIDHEALTRATTYYFPDARLTMLPPEIAEDAASLVCGSARPALSFLVDVDAEGEVGPTRLVASVVRCAARLSYRDADEAVADGDRPDGETLRRLLRAARALECRRIDRGAVRILAPEVDVRVTADGEIRLERIDPGSVSRVLVTESMVLAGAIAARFCSERDLPAMYRRQAPPDPPIRVDGPVVEPVAVRNLRRSLRRGEVGLTPGPHHALGLEAYAQVTSPLRRFQDLATQRQIVAALRGDPPVYDREALLRIAATTDRAESDGRRAERAASEYWLLQLLASRAGEELEGVIVELAPRPVVQLAATLLEIPVPSLPDAELGRTVRLRVAHVNPRAGILRLRPV